jgi:hypothetical protein
MSPELKQLYLSNHIQALADANHKAAKTMEKKGGHFAAALAVAYFHADNDNKARILGAFSDLFEKYRAINTEELRDLA